MAVVPAQRGRGAPNDQAPTAISSTPRPTVGPIGDEPVIGSLRGGLPGAFRAGAGRAGCAAAPALRTATVAVVAALVAAADCATDDAGAATVVVVVVVTGVVTADDDGRAA